MRSESRWLTRPRATPMVRPFSKRAGLFCACNPMKIRNSLRSLKGRHKANRLVRRKGRIYVINKVQRRFKARQG